MAVTTRLRRGRIFSDRFIAYT